MEETREAIVIGGGISGLAAVKCFNEEGIDVKLLEGSSDIGGLWNYRKDQYGVMECTYINVSKQNYCFSDYPFPDETPDFPSHDVMYDYIKSYTKHFNLNELIDYNTRVKSVAKNGDVWEIKCVQTGGNCEKIKIYKCKYVAVATGHHAKPKIPKFDNEDEFEGPIFHSVDYKSATHNQTANKNLLVIGIGNSAVDVAIDNVRPDSKKKVYLSTRSGAWVMNNYVFDEPIDHYASRFFLNIPWQIGTIVLQAVTQLTFGNPFRWNLNPKMKALQSQPTVSPTMYYHLRRGHLNIKRNVKSFTKTGVVLETGECLDVDVVVKCTGYYIDLPFLPDEVTKKFLDKTNNDLTLYKNVFCPEIGSSLGFIGFVQPASGGVLSMSETQSRWMAQLIKGHCLLPSTWDMHDDIKTSTLKHKKRYFNSTRHTIQKDPIIYNDEVAGLFGAKPTIWKHPTLAWNLIFGTCGSSQYRLEGPGSWTQAYEVVKNTKVTPLMHYFGLLLVFICLTTVGMLLSYVF